MEIFFADDSVQRSCARRSMGPVISVGGVLIEEAQLRSLSAEIDAIGNRFGVPEKEEFKWSPKRGSWIYENLHEGDREDCYRQILKAAAAHNARAVVVCWDTARTAEKDQAAFERCVDYLFERVSMNLEDRGSSAIIVADKPGGGKDQEAEFLNNFVERIQKGTDYVLPNRVLLNVLTTPSHLLRHLQLADLVTGVTTAMVAGNDKYARAIFPSVQNLFIKNRPGGVAATGLKIAPDGPRGDSLVNLYYWVLQEKFLHKGGGAVSYPLPVVGLPFEKDGLIP
jgi:hypothetical protein